MPGLGLIVQEMWFRVGTGICGSGGVAAGRQHQSGLPQESPDDNLSQSQGRDALQDTADAPVSDA